MLYFQIKKKRSRTYYLENVIRKICIAVTILQSLIILKIASINFIFVKNWKNNNWYRTSGNKEENGRERISFGKRWKKLRMSNSDAEAWERLDEWTRVPVIRSGKCQNWWGRRCGYATLTKNCLWRMSIASNVRGKRWWKVDRSRAERDVRQRSN